MLAPGCITEESLVHGASRARVEAADPTPRAVFRTAPASFDRVAAIYQPGEYLSFGPCLERCRFSLIPDLSASRFALVLGDGDGRFLARLLAACPLLQAHAVDASRAMLRLLSSRAARAGSSSRLTTICADIRSFTPPATGYDLVASHFFLDCLTAEETDALVLRLRPHLAPGALWVVSEFEVPSEGGWRNIAARAMIAGLYAAFRLLTGLRVRRVPPWRDSLAGAGFLRRSSRRWLGGLLVSELWQLNEATGLDSSRSQPVVPVTSSAIPPAVLCTFGSVPGQVPGPVPGIDPGTEPTPGIPPEPEPVPAPGPPPEPDPMPYPGPLPGPAPVT